MSGGVIWITGLSGVGKTTLAMAVTATLRDRGSHVVLLDGDAVRQALEQRGYDRATRRRLAASYSNLAWLIAGQGCIVVVATVSLFHGIHDRNRRRGPYLEVLLEAPEPLRSQRAGDLSEGPRMGVEQLAEFPLAPHLRLANDDRPATLEILCNRVVDEFDHVHTPVHR